MEGSFCIRTADHIIELNTMYEECAREFCADYICDGKPDISITTAQNDIDTERQREVPVSKDGRIPSDYPDSYLELLSIYRKIAEAMVERNVLLMHGSAISIDGCGVLFIADSGVGKSTHTSFWRKVYGERVVLINDDKPLVGIDEKGAVIYGTPWSGKRGLNTPVSAPLKMIYHLERGANDMVTDMTKSEKWKTLTRQSYKSPNPDKVMHSISMLDRLSANVPVYRLICTKNESAAICAYKHLNDIVRIQSQITF